MAHDWINALILMHVALSLLIWKFFGADPLLQIARSAVLLRCGLIVAFRHAVTFGREWRRDTVRLYRHMRASEGV